MRSPQRPTCPSRISSRGFGQSVKGEPARWPIHTGDFALTAKTADHVLIGRVVYEADGKPAAKAIILQGASNQADVNGRFRIDGLVAGKLELHAAAGNESEAAPPDVSIEIPETPMQIEHTLTLPRGMVVTGRVVDGSSGNGVAKVLVDFAATHNGIKPRPFSAFPRNRTPTDASAWWFHRAAERLSFNPFRLTSLSLLDRIIGQPANPSFSRQVEGRGGQTIEVDISSSPGGVKCSFAWSTPPESRSRVPRSTFVTPTVCSTRRPAARTLKVDIRSLGCTGA